MSNILTNLFNGSGASVVRGTVIRAAVANKNFTTAIASSLAGIQGLIGVVDSGVVGVGGVASVALFGLDFVPHAVCGTDALRERVHGRSRYDDRPRGRADANRDDRRQSKEKRPLRVE